MQNSYHHQSVADVLKHFATTQDGLSLDEVRARVKQEGPNELPRARRVTGIAIFLRQFAGPLMLVLFGALVLSLLIGEWRDAVIIAVAILINTIVGFVQEAKAERASEALQSYEVHEAMVRREGLVQKVAAAELVSGDIVLLESGSATPADIRVIRAIEAQVDEALLTGESFPVAKHAGALPLNVSVGDRTNMVFKGTTVVDGKIEGIVVATGERTRIGLLSKLVQTTSDEATPLQFQLKRFGKILSLLVLGMALALYALGWLLGYDAQEMLKVSVALVVAAIPEGLLVALTVVLAVGMQRMYKRKALIRRLVAAETLGSVSVVCTDKTGTLTEGRMSVARIVTPKNDVKLGERIPDDVYDMFVALVLNNDASVSEGKTIGHPTEAALLDGALKAGVNVAEKRDQFPRRAEIPFRSATKHMATLHAGATSRLIVKGAPEAVFALCRDTNGLEAKADALAKEGLRVLAVAVKDDAKDVREQGLTCLGIVGLSDPVREHAEETLRRLAVAGVRVVMITGDHPSTVASVARHVGIPVSATRIVTGRDLEDMSDERLQSRVGEIDIYARVEPQHKVRIVHALRAVGEVVAMIGDGVNDAAALKAADIGVAVGTATDVTKATSDMVLLDNNLSTIAAAVQEGRILFDNMRKVIVYLLSDSFTEIVLVAGALLLGIPIPITAAQILWINIVSDGFPLMALTQEPGEKDVMRQKPRPKNEPVLSKDMKLIIFLVGMITDVGMFVLYLFLLQGGETLTAHLQTIMFSALAINSLMFVFAIRSFRTTIFRLNPLRNRWLLVAVGAGVIIQVAVVYAPPLQELFGTVGLNAFDWVLIGALAVIKLIGIELAKDLLIYRRRNNVYAPSH